MNSGYKIGILSILGIVMLAISPLDTSSIDFVSAQDSTLGQEEGDNEDSQPENSSQEENQNSMCVSGESTSLSCNNLSSEIIGDSIPGDQGPSGPEGPPGPQGEQGPAGTVDVYKVDGPTIISEQGDSQVSSTATCDPGDSVTGGGLNTNLNNGDIRRLTSTPNNSLDAWTAMVSSSSGIAGDTTITAFAVCQDNAP